MVVGLGKPYVCYAHLNMPQGRQLATREGKVSMLSSPINIALSGISAAATKVAVSAKNIANFQSTSQLVNGEVVNEPYQADQVTQTSLSSGNVLIDIGKSELPPSLVYDPDNASANEEGFVSYPNISLESEMVNQAVAAHEFQANLATIERAKEMDESLLDILS